MMILRRVIGGAALVMMGSCSDLTSYEEALDAAEQRWNAAAIANYSFDVQHLCFCPPEVTRPVTVTVVGGAFSSLVYSDSGTAADTALFRDYLTVPRMFDLVRRSLDQEPDSAMVSYDPAFGYPTVARFDFQIEIADEEFRFEVSALRRP